MLQGGGPGALLELDEVRDRDRREDANDRNHDHQLDQGKALLNELFIGVSVG